MTRRLIHLLIYIGLLLTPIMSLPAVVLMSTRAPTDGLPPAHELIAIKAAKDALLLMIFVVFFLDVLAGHSLTGCPFVWLLAGGICISFLVSFFRAGPVLALIGLRAISTFILIFIGYRYIDRKALGTIVKILCILLMVEACVAFVRAFYGVPIDGRTFFGLVARPSGTFAAPSSWSVFISLMACYILGFDISVYGRARRRTWFVVALAGLLVYLSSAGAGILAFAALLVSYFLFLSRVHPYMKAAVLPFLLLAPVLILTNLALLTGRPHAFRSVESRIGIIGNIISTMDATELVVGKGLGVCSDAAVTMQLLHPDMLGDINGVFASDSLYAAIVGQMGLASGVVFLALNVHVLRGALRTRDRGVHPIVVLAIPSILAGASGSVTTEVFPVNWLLFMLYGMALNRRSDDSSATEHDTDVRNVHLAPRGSAA